jgi:hypothetical protein
VLQVAAHRPFAFEFGGGIVDDEAGQFGQLGFLFGGEPRHGPRFE